MSKTANRFCATTGPVDEEGDLGSPAGQSPVADAHSAFSWVPGEEPPPFTIDNPAAVKLCVQIISGESVELPAIVVSEAVAVQIYRLVRDRKAPPELKASEISAVYVISASLARHALVAPDAAAATRLDKVLARKTARHRLVGARADRRRGPAPPRGQALAPGLGRADHCR